MRNMARLPTGPDLTVELIVAATALVACSAATPQRAQVSSSPTHTTSSSTARPTPTQAIPEAATLRCKNYINQDAPSPDLQVILGAIALPTTPTASALQTAPTGLPDPALRLYAKTGLVVRGGTTAEIEVSREARNRLAIGWGGAPPAPAWLIRISCPPAAAGQSRWFSYAGGYWLPKPDCLRLIVRVGHRTQVVHIGLGTPCPGQRSPEGPSYT